MRVKSEQALGNARAVALLVFAIGVVLTVWTSSERFIWIFRNLDPIATDAYYYLQEFKSYARKGTGYYQKDSLFFSLCSVFISLFHLSPERAYQYLTVFGLVVFASALTLAGWSKKNWWISPLFCLPLFLSDLLVYRHYAFPKQALAISLFALGFVFWIRASTLGRGAWWGVFLFVVSSMIHVFCAALSALTLVLPLKPVSANRWISSPLRLTLAIGLCLLGLWYLWMTPKQILISKWPMHFVGWMAACDYAQCSVYEQFEFWLLTMIVLALILMGATIVKLELHLWFLIALFILLNLPIWTPEGHMSYRLAFASPWIVLILISLLSSRADGQFLSVRAVTLLVFCGCLSVGFFSFSRKTYAERWIPASIMKSKAAEVRDFVKPNAIVIAPHGLQFRISYFWDLPATKDPTTSHGSSVYHLRAKSCRRHDLKSCLSISPEWSLQLIQSKKNGK